MVMITYSAAMTRSCDSGWDPRGDGAAPIRLTPRERDVLRLLVEGLGDIEIARALGLRPRTVSEHVSNLLEKTMLPNRVALAVYAVRRGLV
jgi:DNA-binding NarL/FixJ family response regulator